MESDHNDDQESLSISSEELKRRLKVGEEPLIVFDIGNENRYKKEHIPGSWFINWKTKDTVANLLQKLPKDIDNVLVGDYDNENHIREIATQVHNKYDELRIRYLQGGLSAWRWKKTANTDPKITSNELKKAIDQNKINREIFLVDVREQDEFKGWNIEGSRNIPLNQIPSLLNQIPRNKKKEVVTICPAGNRSGIATLLLQQLGYNKVRTLQGGLRSWSSAYEYIMEEFELEKDKKKIRLVQIRRIGKGCLSYILEADFEAAVIDPVFPVEYYIKIAEGDGMKAKINKVFDTHLHADHISAAKKLAEKTNAQLYLSHYEEGYNAELRYNSTKLNDGDILMIGSVRLKVIYSPGHTIGSISLLAGGKLLFTGDTLFIDNIGRPDLFKEKEEEKEEKEKVTEEFANMLHDTLHQKLFRIPDETAVFPAHYDKLVREDILVTSSLANIKKSKIFKSYLD